jgi:acyl-CoA synthetase (AMP-forming)/AMP-acid ligase II/thioesterase domain-containing protein/acyl carrier protein
MTETGPFAAAVPGSIPDAFRAAVERFGDRRALEIDGVVLTYAEVDALSNRIAHGLLARGGREPLAMVAHLEPMSVIVMLGALKAGRAFAPLDPRDPPERVQRIREQLGALLVSRDDAIDRLAVERADDPALALDPQQPSLVNFTSGSTGRPKGTVKSHRQLSWAPVGCGVTPDDRFAITLPLSFGAGHAPVLGALLVGACGCFFDPIEHGIEAMADWLAASGVTMHMTSPSALRATASALEASGRAAESVRLVILGGEGCEAHHLQVARRVLPEAVMMNVYGSTEAGFIASTSIAPGEQLVDGPIPLTRVFPWHSVDIVDQDGHPIPIGDTGEIVVRGPDIALGYWEDPEEEKQRFITLDGLERAVRTGDRGRLRPDGTLEHLGRVDLRVKVHGQMVDLQAVEQELAELPAVREAIVSAVSDADGDVRLVAHVVPETDGSVSPSDLRAALAARLPPFMIPSTFIVLGAVPRNVWGKVDRAGLRRAAQEGALYETEEYTEPRDSREAALADIVSEVLELERVGPADDLFALGLDSFTQTELLVAIEDRLDARLTPLDLYRAPTIEALARQVAEPSSEEGVVRSIDLGGSGTPFFCVPGGDFRIRNLLLLARLLDRPMYSFVPLGFERRALPDRTVERVAARFVGGLRTVQPCGPYLIGGYSFGSVIAVEMAQQIRSTGEDVALLVLLDPTWLALPVAERIRQFALGSAASRRTPFAVVRRVARQAAVSAEVRARVATAGIIARSYAGQCRVFLALSGRMGRRYRARPYDGPTLLVTAQGRDQSEPVEMAEFLTGRTDVADVPGAHDAILHEPFVATLAALVEDALSAADAAVRPPGVA